MRGDEILYGHVGARSHSTDVFRDVTNTGITECYDRYGLLYCVELDDGVYYSIESADVHFHSEGKGVLYLDDGLPHKEDGPAYQDQELTEWYHHGLLHRLDGPAVTCPSYQAWYKDDRLHRGADADGCVGPALVSDDEKVWYQNGLRHREDGPAMIRAGSKYWYHKDRLHREDGPAVEYANGAVEYWWCGGYHREDGPAIVDTDGIERYALDGNLFEDKRIWEQALRAKRRAQLATIEPPG